MLQNRYFQFIFICILGVFTFACIDNAEALKNAKKTVLNISETNDKFKRQLNTMTANYYNLSDAIANENMEDIRKSAYATISNIRQIDINLLNDQQQLNWNLKSEMIKFSLEEIVKYEDLNEIRINFNDLSNWIQQAITEFGLTNGITYVYQCNDALENEGGKWLSSNTDAENPYGKDHSGCGDITEQVKFE